MADRRLQVFHAVARQLSFTRAADALFMTQPAVTFQVRQLEEQYGTRLFERRHGGIQLTPAGELMLSYAERILALAAEMDTRLAEINGEMRGTLLLGAASGIAATLLPGVLAEFNARYPQVRPRLIVANSQTIAGAVADHSLDLGLVEAGQAPPGLAGELCRADELVAVCPPAYPLAGLAGVAPRTLAEYEYLAREPGSGTRAVVDAWFAGAGVAADSLKTQLELGSNEALKGVVATGLGFAILPRPAVTRDIEFGTLLAIPLDPPLSRNIWLVQPEDRFRSRLVSTFASFARQQLKELPA
jgi:DNA-binding transcriptional LysR family regulator